ncbi:MAG: 16S rRNA (adenine(1518)-N(6)/adenine(1519)-N(6))-dimethyltransferase RsmA [Bacteroidota bacterium]
MTSVVRHATPSIRPKKSLGQNFLRDENIARKIVAAINPQPDDVLLEIGPGEGVLTKYLAGSVKSFTIIDIDQRAVARMQEMFPEAGIQIVHQDFLETDLSKLAGGQRLRVAGNIPYNITSPILFHVLDNRQHVVDLTIMMQREVARRLVAPRGTKDYGILAVFCQLFADVKLLFDVPPTAFFPKPKVMSSVVRLTMHPLPIFPLQDERFFRSMVRSVFGKRRKTLRNSLMYFLGETPLPGGLSVDLQRRPEDLTIQELVELSNQIYTTGPDVATIR